MCVCFEKRDMNAVGISECKDKVKPKKAANWQSKFVRVVILNRLITD